MVLKGERVGTVIVQANVGDIGPRLRERALKLVLLLLASTALVGGMAVALERVVTRPLLRLSVAARCISERQDYTLRVLGDIHDCDVMLPRVGHIESLSTLLRARRGELFGRFQDLWREQAGRGTWAALEARLEGYKMFTRG